MTNWQILGVLFLGTILIASLPFLFDKYEDYD